MKHLLLFSAAAILSISAGAFTTYTETPVKPGANSLVYPVSGKKSKVGGFFGDYRNGGRSHKGVDIYAKKGTAVVAICDGIITSTATENLGGKTIRLRSADHSWTAYYAHLDKLHVRPGQWVQKGQAIGTVGTTGNAKHKAAHLHFGIIGGGRAVNPLPYVKHSKKIANPVIAAKIKARVCCPQRIVKERPGNSLQGTCKISCLEIFHDRTIQPITPNKFLAEKDLLHRRLVSAQKF